MMKVVVGVPPTPNPAAPQRTIARHDSAESPQILPSIAERQPSGPDYFLQKTSEAAAVFPIEDLEWEKLSIDELLAMASTMSLMGDTRVFRLGGALNGARADEFLDITKELVDSPHQFILTEEKLLKRPMDVVTKACAEVVVHAAPKKVEAFNMFSMTFTFAARDRKKLWLELHESLRKGVVPEAFAGMLHWKVRDMLARRSFSEGGLSKGVKGKYTKEELCRISGELVSLYHDSHRGAGELSLLLERYILQL